MSMSDFIHRSKIVLVLFVLCGVNVTLVPACISGTVPGGDDAEDNIDDLDQDGIGNDELDDGPSPSACPGQALLPVTEGCTVTLRTPADCATVSIGAEFAWEGDACHTPYYLQIAGNSASEIYNDIYIESYVNVMAWAVPLDASYLEGLITDDGWYHWRICNAYENGCSGTRAFRLD